MTSGKNLAKMIENRMKTKRKKRSMIAPQPKSQEEKTEVVEIHSLDSDDEKPPAKTVKTKHPIVKCTSCGAKCGKCNKKRKEAIKKQHEEAGTSPKGDTDALQNWRTFYKTWCGENSSLCEGKTMADRAKMAGVSYRIKNKRPRDNDQELYSSMFGTKTEK